MNDIESIFRKLACAFCRFPDDLRVSYAESNQSIIVVYTAHADDTRKLIGKGGAMYKALETVLAAVTARRRLKSRLIVDEPHTGQPLETVRFETNTNWTETRVRMLMIEICMLLFTEQPEITFHRISTDASTLLLQVGETEVWGDVKVEDLSQALSRIFEAIGRNQGRKIFVEISVDRCHNR